jgi:hypothetical protein
MEQATQYWQAAEAAAGYGAPVDLPSYPLTSLPPVQGLGYAAGAEPAPMPGNPRLTLVPDYASDIVGGSLHHGAPVARSSDAALSRMTFTSLPPVWRSSMTYAPASEPWPKRFAAAVKRMFGRS